MKKLLLILLLSASSAFAWDQAPPQQLQACTSQIPYGMPQSQRQGPVICRHAYISQNDTTAKLPIWVSYALTPQHALGCVPRSNAFAPDASLPKGQRAELKDYAGSGFDMGHNANDGDMSFDNQAELESFLLSNMSPQYPATNRGSFKLVESTVRAWAKERNHELVVYVGSIYNAQDPVIGQNRIVVPHALFKIVIDTITNETMGFIFPNINVNQGNDIRKWRASIQQIEQQTGINFTFPQGVKELPVGQEWPVDYGALTKMKREQCGINSSD